MTDMDNPGRARAEVSQADDKPHPDPTSADILLVRERPRAGPLKSPFTEQPKALH